jgi:hypothetical protein
LDHPALSVNVDLSLIANRCILFTGESPAVLQYKLLLSRTVHTLNTLNTKTVREKETDSQTAAIK